jgi:arsenite transporter
VIKLLSTIRKNLHYLILLGIIVGLLNVYIWGGITVPKTFLVSFVIVFVIYPVMINTKFEEIAGHFRQPRPLLCSLITNFALSPLIAFTLGKIFLADQPEFFAAFILISLLPTSAMSAAWTAFSGARLSTALYLIPANLLFAALIGLPFIFPLLIGNILDLKIAAIVKNVLLVFGLPLLAGDLTRRFFVKWKGQESFERHIKPNIGSVSALGVFILILIVMSQDRNTVILNNSSYILKITVPLVLYYALLYLSGLSITKYLTRKKYLTGDKAIVIVFTSVARHINISLALVLSAFDPQQSTLMILLILAAYIIQVPSLAFFSQTLAVRFLDTCKDNDLQK